ncbi:IclR family transcriptional regulator [Mycolicibacterium sp. CBM1]
MDADPSEDQRGAIDKAFQILDALGADPGAAVSATELARRVGLYQSTTYRVLVALQRNGMVERVGTKYRLAGGWQQLTRANGAQMHTRLADALLPYLTELFVKTKHTVHLATLDHVDVLYLAKLHGHASVATPSTVGGKLPAHCTAAGKAILAYNPDAVAAIVASPLRRLTPRSITDPNVLARQLAAVHRDGVAVEHHESRMGVACVAAPVLGRSGKGQVAISISVPAHVDLGPMSRLLRSVCASVSRALASN